MPKITGGSLAEHRRRTRTALFDALSKLMRERGFDAISLADIASRAGIGRTAVYNHFPDKESMLLAFIEHETSAYVETLRAALADVADPTEQIRVYVRNQLLLERSYHFAPGPDLREVLSRDAGRHLREHVAQVEQLLGDILAGAVTEGRIPDQPLDTVVQLVHACLSGRTMPAEEPARSEFITATEQFVLRALGADERAADGAAPAAADDVDVLAYA